MFAVFTDENISVCQERKQNGRSNNQIESRTNDEKDAFLFVWVGLGWALLSAELRGCWWNADMCIVVLKYNVQHHKVLFDCLKPGTFVRRCGPQSWGLLPSTRPRNAPPNEVVLMSG